MRDVTHAQTVTGSLGERLALTSGEVDEVDLAGDGVFVRVALDDVAFVLSEHAREHRVRATALVVHAGRCGRTVFVPHTQPTLQQQQQSHSTRDVTKT